MKYSIICADPPWGAFKDKLTMSQVKRGAAANYNTLSTDELCALPVKDIADPDGAILCLWCPSSLLSDGLRIMEAWGFSLRQSFVWVKIKRDKSIKKELYGKKMPDPIIGDNILGFNMGRLMRQTHEICLIGINNTKIYEQMENRSQRSVCFAPNLKHSAKPESLQDALDVMFPNAQKAELFARRVRPGWDCFGNECETTKDLDIRVVLDNILNDRAPNTPPQ